jgi:hypothetical protein
LQPSIVSSSPSSSSDQAGKLCGRASFTRPEHLLLTSADGWRQGNGANRKWHFRADLIGAPLRRSRLTACGRTIA